MPWPKGVPRGPRKAKGQSMTSDPLDDMMAGNGDTLGLEAEAPKTAASQEEIARVLADPTVTDIIRQSIDAAVRAQLALAVPAVPPQGADLSLFAEFSRTITELVNQGTPHSEKKVPPEVMERREAGRKQMLTLISERNAAIRANPGDDAQWPFYRVMDFTFIHESWLTPMTLDQVSKRMLPTEFFFDGVPNRALMPLNAHAKAIHRAFMQWTGGNGVPNAPALEEIAITPNGMYFKGQMPQTMRKHNYKVGEIHNAHFEEDPDVMEFRQQTGTVGPLDPTASHVRILGTLAQPAVQSSSGETPQMRAMRLSVPGGTA
jgi:hypothetical protein